jgi:hypothetical protein
MFTANVVPKEWHLPLSGLIAGEFIQSRWLMLILVGGLPTPSERLLFPTYEKIKHVPNHQPVMYYP